MYALTITPRLGDGPLLQPGEAERLLFERIEALLWEAVLFLQEGVKEATPVGVLGEQGGLRGSIYGEVTGASLLELKGVVSSPLPYAEPVELGTAPHAPPLAPLLRWVEVKLGKVGREAVATAWAIRGAIKQRGTRGQFMFAHTLALAEPALEAMAARAGADVAVQWTGAP